MDTDLMNLKITDFSYSRLHVALCNINDLLVKPCVKEVVKEDVSSKECENDL